jgi:hypothetical protein
VGSLLYIEYLDNTIRKLRISSQNGSEPFQVKLKYASFVSL